ncbi:hypothetical protein [Bacillus wiedmannii]|uniref:hypothetical protein n=1 Tax=Bacillus wiedmannii TaxID=1890302 RepID=UPI000BF15C59|nr:hypothetical protein [Bacillus wiedmannii]PEM52671.1 hypothetical protein CN618_07115 [Bacillus wiedmannii]
MSIDKMKLKLEVKEQWLCDYCGEVIKSDKDGMLEWDSFLLEDDREFSADNFRIVHRRDIKNCRPKHADDYLSDGHLHWYTGSQGLSELLSLQARHTLDTLKFHKIIRRLHVDYYEEAIFYLPQALEDGEDEIDLIGDGNISAANLNLLIKRHCNK